MKTVTDDRALQAAALAFRLAGKDLRRRINDSTRSTFNQPWRTGIEGRATRKVERLTLAKGARIAAGNPPVFVAASSTRALRGGLVPTVLWPAIEFGGKAPNLVRRRKRGPVFTTVREMAHRVPSLWAQIIVKVYNDAAKG